MRMRIIILPKKIVTIQIHVIWDKDINSSKY